MFFLLFGFFQTIYIKSPPKKVLKKGVRGEELFQKFLPPNKILILKSYSFTTQP